MYYYSESEVLLIKAKLGHSIIVAFKTVSSYKTLINDHYSKVESVALYNKTAPLPL